MFSNGRVNKLLYLPVSELPRKSYLLVKRDTILRRIDRWEIVREKKRKEERNSV